ncbi:hypothetical protein GCM10010483_67310 [Actinokineospora diospyrosa]
MVVHPVGSISIQQAMLSSIAARSSYTRIMAIERGVEAGLAGGTSKPRVIW